MKKLLLLILTLMVSLCAISSGGIAFAAVSVAECDEVFVSTLEQLLSAENAEETEFVSSKTLIYDLNLMPLGYIYCFTANNVPGFAIIINSNDVYECTEIYFDALNPYALAEENDKCVYINIMTYWLNCGESYYDTSKENEIPSEMVNAVREKAYFASNLAVDLVPENIYYTYRSENEYKMAFKHPYLVADIASCVPTTAANIVQFYDRYSPNLIPNYEPGMPMASIYIYKNTSTYTDTVCLQLVSDMGMTGAGATISQFKEGVAKYSNNRGYNATFNSCMRSGQFNYDIAKQQMESGKPIAIFVDPYSYELITENDGSDLIQHVYSTVPHSMAVFGYRDITYTLNNGQTRNDQYLQVATGRNHYESGYCKLNSYTTIDDALAVHIY